MKNSMRETCNVLYNSSMKESQEILKCTRCERELNNSNTIWLELSNTDDKYYVTLPEGHESQGGFPFRKTCSEVDLVHLLRSK